MPKNNDIEEILLSDLPLDELIKQKIAREMDDEIAKSKQKSEKKLVKSFLELQKDKTFDKSTIYTVFNRLTKQESFVNGLQVESILGTDYNTMNKLINKQIECFLTDEYYVKFHSASDV